MLDVKVEEDFDWLVDTEVSEFCVVDDISLLLVVDEDMEMVIELEGMRLVDDVVMDFSL